MAIKKKDFIELEYTGKEKDSGDVFDTTDKAIAEKQEIFNKNMDYGPVIICIGESHILKALDERIEGKEIGSYTFELEPEQAFGNKSAKLIQLIPTNKFKKEGINPVPGLQINVDGMPGVIKTVTGGRTLVDFNHPLSGKTVVYDINIKRKVTDDKEKLHALMKNKLGLMDIEIELAENEARVTTKYEVPKEIQEVLTANTKELIPSVKEVVFVKNMSKKE